MAVDTLNMNADLQVLMEQLRQRSHIMKSWTDLIKAAKTNMKEKRSPLDAEDRAQIQQCLELLHKTATVTTSRELFEHIEEVALKTGLSLAPSPSSPHCRFVMSECFFIEIQAKENGIVDKVFINHGQTATSKSYPLLVSLINKRRWDEVIKHLNGLIAGYNVAGDKSIKIDAFNALQSLEQHVESHLGQKTTEGSAQDQILRSPLGAFRVREAGRASRLHYFLTPYDLLDPRDECITEPTVRKAFEREIGLWAALAMASSTDAVPLVATFKKDSVSMSDPSAKTSTIKVQAKFSLKLSEPMVISAKTALAWENINCRPTIIKTGNYVQLVQDKAQCCVNAFHVVMPDQKHAYLLDALNHDHLAASLISSIEFCDVNHIATIIGDLRREALFATIMNSVIREKSSEKDAGADSWIFELTSPRLGQIDCVLAEDDLTKSIKVRFVVGNLDELEVQIANPDDTLVKNVVGTNVLRKSWSIPVTMRTILKKRFPDSPLNHLTNSNQGADNDDQSNTRQEDVGKDGSSADEHPEENGHDHSQESNIYESPKKTKFDAKTAYEDIFREVCESMPSLIDTQQFREFSEINLPSRQNLLDLFKEIEVWEALIPPRPGQKPLRSPAPQSKMRPIALPPFQMQTSQPSAGMMSPGFGTGGPPGPPPAMIGGMTSLLSGASSKSPKPRHMSSASDTFEEMNELCNLSRAFAEPESKPPISGPGSLAGTPVGDKPMSLLLERKSSIQDTIDSVLGSAMQPGTPMAQSPLGAIAAAEMRHRLGIGAERIMHSLSLDHGEISGIHPHQHMQHQHQARSASVAGLGGGLSGRSSVGATTTTINLDVFDFEKSDAIESGMTEQGMGGPLQRWHSFHEMDQMASKFGAGPGGGPMTPAYMGQCDPHSGTPLSPGAAFRGLGVGPRGGRGRGSRGGGVPGRRRSRRALNVGDRTVEMALKELKKAERISRGGTGTRRPRRARGTLGTTSGVPSAQIVTSTFSEGDSPKFTLKIVQPGAGAMSGGMGHGAFGGQEMVSPPGSTRQAIQQQPQPFHFGSMPQQHHQSQQQYPLPAPVYKEPTMSGGGFGEDSQDTAELAKAFPDAGGSDEILRQQIQALKQHVFSNVNFGNLDERSSDATADAEKLMEDATPPARVKQEEQEEEQQPSTDFGSTGGNLFDNLASATNFGQQGRGEPETATPTAPATLSGEETVIATVRVPGKRRGSLDTVIGKLMADKTAVTAPLEEHGFFGGANESSSGSGDSDPIQHPTAKRMRLELEEDEDSGGGSEELTSGSISIKKEDSISSPFVKDSGESTPEGSQTGAGEGIKLVIKKSALKIPGAPTKPVGRPPGAAKQKDKLSPSGTTPKRASPNVTELSKGAQQLQGEQKSAFVSQNDLFESLRKKVAEKKLKKPPEPKIESVPVPTTTATATKVPKVEKARKSIPADRQKVAVAEAEKTPPKSAPPTNAPGPEAMVFGKSLKGFKIPKIDDSASTKASVAPPIVPVVTTQSTSAGGSFKKPPFHPQSTPANMPKPILKHSVSTPAPAALASLVAANTFVPIISAPAIASPPVGRLELSPTFRPYTRRTLLPDPMEPPPSTSGAGSSLGRLIGSFGGQMAPDRFSGVGGEIREKDPYASFGQEAIKSKTPKYDLLLGRSSPDSDGLVIDDTSKSPSSLNTSKESVALPSNYFADQNEEELLTDPTMTGATDFS